MKNTNTWITLITLSLLVFSGCSWFGDGDDEPEEIKPNPLPKIRTETSLKVIWNKKIGKGVDDKALRIEPKIIRKRVFVGTPDGNIRALGSESGREIWAVNVKDFFSEGGLASGFPKNLDVITGGIEADSELVLLCSGSGHLVALNQSDGSFAWKTQISSESLAPPKIDGDLVVVQTVDGKVSGYESIDGSLRWEYAAKTPALSLRGTATPSIFEDIVIAGFSNGRVAFITRDEGLAALEQSVGVSQGISDLERLVDVDGAMAIENNGLFISGYQGRVLAIDLRGGKMLWEQEASSIAGLGVGFGNVYLVSADSQVIAYNASNGREVWRVDSLLNRGLNSPLVLGSYLMISDYEGYLHLLAQSDGRFVGRKKIDSRGVGARLIEKEGRIYAMGNGGSLFALEIR
ncbi:MAG: outer membrane protein assembly factor BamB [Gammaproteobacteria bacterium]|nr:outer membrane protein assembly factor BamB [Gammaproteobacteria bacterium]